MQFFLVVGFIVNLCFVCVKQSHFPSATQLKEEKERDKTKKDDTKRQQFKIGADEVKFYIKFLEWIILLIAFT